VSVIAHVGLCLAVLALPIYAALLLVPPHPEVAWLQRPSAAVGVVSMLALPVLCIATMLRKPWARPAMLAYAGLSMAWETVKLALSVVLYAPVYTRILRDEFARQAAEATTQATTQAATRPTGFDSFLTFGIYVMAALTWLIFAGFAFAAWKVYRRPAAAEHFRS
jgi:hypothetical protein